MPVPFFIRRPWLMLSQWLTDRDRPDLEALRAIRDPDKFLWAILPHAARTFASCITLLPPDKARAAAVGYLYCRSLDTYEDLAPESEKLLDIFGRRFEDRTPTTAPRIEDPLVQDIRDHTHLLLLECMDRVDAVYEGLSTPQREAIARCVRQMSIGMKARRARGHGDILAYCRAVIGYPVVFSLELLLERQLQPDETETAMQVGEMVQLANITRDIEKDLSRGVVYDRRLSTDSNAEKIRVVREDLMRLAIDRAPAYRQLMEMLESPRFQLGRASALLMLLFTSRYYEDCARQMGYGGWSASRSTMDLFAKVFPAAFSHRYALRAARHVESALAGFSKSFDGN